MAEMMLAEFVATGALLMFWFQGLFAGKRFWPNNCAMAGVAAIPIAMPAINRFKRQQRIHRKAPPRAAIKQTVFIYCESVTGCYASVTGNVTA